MANKFNTGQLLENIATLKRELPILLGNQAQRYFTAAFKEQGWDGKKWEEVKRRQEGTQEYKYPMRKGLTRRTKPILVLTGKLRRAESMSLRNATFTNIKLVNALPYASYQNEGTATIPQRKYMGDSPILRQKQTELITKQWDKAFNV